jgi:hypothetical protein
MWKKILIGAAAACLAFGLGSTAMAGGDGFSSGAADLSRVQVEDALQSEIASELSANAQRIENAINGNSAAAVTSDGDTLFDYSENAATGEAEPQYDKAFKAYYMSSIDFVEAYNGGEGLDGAVSEDFFVNVPVAVDGALAGAVELHKVNGVDELDLSELPDGELRDGIIAYATENAGSYKISRIGRYMSPASAEIYSDADSLQSLLSEGSPDDVSGISDVKIVSLLDHYGEVVCFADDAGAGYAIPVGLEAALGLDQRLYSMEELAETVAQSEYYQLYLEGFDASADE